MKKIFLLLSLSLFSLQIAYANYKYKKLTVTATAYNSLPEQTDSTPDIAAWGDKLKPGMKVIAVSRDLLKRGLKRNTRVIIKGLPGFYLVKDKMHQRFRKKIDIFMGKNKKKALKWGSKKVTIYWYDKK